MEKRRLLVDYENVPQCDLSTLADDFGVTIFGGSCQKTLPFELVQAAQNLGGRMEWLKVDGSGNNTRIAQGLRPATRKSLARHVNSIFQKKLTELEVQRLVNLLFTEGKVVETDESLIYDL